MNVKIKNANGMGSVYKLKGNRRRPWVACVTTDYEMDDTLVNGYRQKRKIIGYFDNESEAQTSLWNYNRNPVLYNELSNLKSLTFQDVYRKWAKIKYKNLSKNTIKGYRAAFQRCEDIWSIRMVDLKAFHFQEIMAESELSLSSDLKLKALMSNLCDFALQNDIVDRNYAKFIMINHKDDTEAIHKPFIKREIKILMEHDEEPYVDTILMMIYTGMRVGELLQVKCQDIDLKNMTLTGGLKTKAGKRRMIPIHEHIQKYVFNRFSIHHEYLIRNQNNEGQMCYQNYRTNYFDKIMMRLNMEHLPHDCRHTFATMLNNQGANTTSIKKLMGHTSFELTERVYTHKDLAQLRIAIEVLE